MAHFAQLDENNVVQQVIVVSNNELLDANGVEREELGIAFCQKLFGGNWKQTSYNSSFRKNYAGIGYTYYPDLDAFISPKPYESWVLNTTSKEWEAPTAPPSFVWDENTQSWVQSPT